MFSYAENSSFDAIIIETAVISKYVTNDTLSSILKRYKDTPIVTVSEKIDNYPCISFEANGIEQEIDHLVNHHKKRKIAFVSGPSSNLEALQRFDEYKKALEKNHIDFDPELVAEGDFTDECTDVIRRLLDKKLGEIDAICFANDNMALAGYHEISSRGIEIGKDLMITGFDDIPEALYLKPSLTTIRASYRELGENAIEAVLDLLEGRTVNDKKISTSLITRDSCGCKSATTLDRESLEYYTYNDTSLTPFVNKINDILFSYSNNKVHTNNRVINLFLRFIYKLLEQAEAPETPVDKNLIEFKFSMLLSDNILSYISTENFNFLLSSICSKAVALADSAEKKESIYGIFMNFFKQIIVFKQKENHNSNEIIKEKIHSINAIIANVMESYECNLQNPLDVIHKFNQIDIKSCYLFLHDNPIKTNSRYDWTQPDYEILNSYHNGDDIHSFSKGKKILAQYIFKNEYMPSDRTTFIASPIFCREENYGLILYNMAPDDFMFYNSFISSQISYSIKLRNMLIAQKEIQSHLIESLNEANNNNKMLSQISRSDELTGIYNRRGFIERVISSIKHNSGKRAVIIYADMDNLKQINDIFGHDDGDFAIKKAADILKECIRSNDIVARFGGDEFAAFAVTHETDFCQMFLARLKEACERANTESHKPYNVTISAGLHEFICDKNVDLTKVMNEADAELYAMKKQKSTNVLKNPEDIHKFRR